MAVAVLGVATHVELKEPVVAASRRILVPVPPSGFVEPLTPVP
jgi:hypothetical protein